MEMNECWKLDLREVHQLTFELDMLDILFLEEIPDCLECIYTLQSPCNYLEDHASL